ncbi:MAG: hypothetical protein S4CHLAM81_12140 [Chlamydiales bacterium]|nr:hypothetical protein [Chlamydiales bacterium]MCH9635990.1 hypothetical protein [Chlamydiales bacterium]MCH9703765.1 hypothetical protein [Chlamydiota bacterium]
MNRQKNVAEIRRLIQEKKEAFPKLARFLTSKGVAPDLAEKITIDYIGSSQEVGALPKILANYINTSDEITFEEPKVLAFVGPTGVGKSITLLKIANHHSDKRVQIISKPEDYQEGFDLTLIDTEGCNYYLENRVDAVGEMLAELPPAEVHLCLSATTKDVDLYGAIHQFSPLAPSHLIFTKLDETLTLGSLMNVCAKCDLPIRYVSFGYPLPGKLELADASKIVRKMLADLNEPQFVKLRFL